MRGPTPKVLLPLLGRPMVSYVLSAVRALSPEKILMVVGSAAETVRHEVGAADIEFVLQPEPNGTAQAVMVCEDFLTRSEEPVMVLCGDVPLVTVGTLQRLVQAYYDGQAFVSLITAHLDKPDGYGRIVRNGTGDVAGIIEDRDAPPAVRAIKEINVGMYVFQTSALRAALAELSPSPITQEYYLTDTIQKIAQWGRVVGVGIDDPEEIVGVNTPEELAAIEVILGRRRGNENNPRGGS